MNPGNNLGISISGRKISSRLHGIFTSIIPSVIFFVLLIVFVRCESKERFYRPNLPEKLCSIGIIDADDTSDYNLILYPHYQYKPIIRFIALEKSYQSEYPQEIRDSLREFSFSISSSEKELYSYKSNSTIKDLKDFAIPANIEFRSGENYYLSASEKNTAKMSAVSYVPEPPSKLNFISLSSQLTTSECNDPNGIPLHPAVNIKFSFDNDSTQNLYYAIHIEGIITYISTKIYSRDALLYEVKECNSPGFFAELIGYSWNHQTCINNKPEDIKLPLLTYFIEGSKIPDNKCIVTILTSLHDTDPGKWRKKIKIKILSVPKELFLFEKSLNTYYRNSADPFSEPVYLNGNINCGNGVFAICRSTELTVNLPISK
jgi:hypothetical protein